jgi:hypothetical protein
MWPWLIGLAVFLFPVDIAIRRLIITRHDLEIAWAATLGKLWPNKGSIVERSEQVSRLFEAKLRAGTTEPDLRDPPSSASRPIQALDTADQAHETSEAPPEIPQHEPPDENATEAATSLATRLLEARRQQQSDSGKD